MEYRKIIKNLYKMYDSNIEATVFINGIGVDASKCYEWRFHKTYLSVWDRTNFKVVVLVSYFEIYTLYAPGYSYHYYKYGNPVLLVWY